MPIIKQSKKLDGANSIYRASRRVAARQLENMKGVALDTGETTVQSPIPTSNNSPDIEGLVPKLLQNISDVNGLLTSLKMVGASDAKPKRGAGVRKVKIGGAISRETRGLLLEDIKKKQYDIKKTEVEIMRLKEQLHDNNEIVPRSVDEKKSKEKEGKRLQRLLDTRKDKIILAKNAIADAQKRLSEPDEDTGGKEEAPAPSPPPPEQDRNRVQQLLINNRSEIQKIIDLIDKKIQEGARNIPKEVRDKLARLVDTGNNLRQQAGMRADMEVIDNVLYIDHQRVYPGKQEENPPEPEKEEKAEYAKQQVYDNVKDIERHIDDVTEIMRRTGAEELPEGADDRLGELVATGNQLRQAAGMRGDLQSQNNILYKDGTQIYPLEEEDRPQSEQDVDDIGDIGDIEDYDADEIAARFDFSKVSKSTLLVILNQLKSVVKAGEIILKKIIHRNVMAGEGDLNELADELSDVIYSKRFLYTHIEQIMRKSRDLGDYLRTILSGVLSKYIEALKIYVKRYAQLNRRQINRLQENVGGDEQADEIPEPDEAEPEEEGAGRSQKGYNSKSIVMSDAVKRISKFDRKYIL